MAVKKATKGKDVSAAPTTVVATEIAPQETTKAEGSEPRSAAPKKAAAPLKLSASQGELLKRIGGAAQTGYSVEKKVEQRSVDSLLEKKLIKKGAKDTATGNARYHISSAGKKHIS